MTDTFVAAGALRGSFWSCGGSMVPYDVESARKSRRSKNEEAPKGGFSEDWASEDDMRSLASRGRMSGKRDRKSVV